nr:hypothetical protein Q903MT_gene393 [Picea sitchensis]
MDPSYLIICFLLVLRCKSSQVPILLMRAIVSTDGVMFFPYPYPDSFPGPDIRKGRNEVRTMPYFPREVRGNIHKVLISFLPFPVNTSKVRS